MGVRKRRKPSPYTAEWQETFRRLRRRGYSAWKELVDEHTPPVYAFVRQRVDSIDDAKDLVQTVFLKFFRAMKRFRGECSVMNHLMLIARRLVIDYWRKKRRSPHLLSLDATIQSDKGDERDGIQLADPGPSVREILDLKERIQKVKQAFPSLSEDCRTILVLSFTGSGMKDRKIAKFLKIRAGYVAVQRYRCLRELLRRMKEGK